jgi:hypothetical protein
MENTREVNDLNNKILRYHISMKNSDVPYYPDPDLMKDTLTDYDHFPYTRWFRGKYYYPNPVVAERDAGFRGINNNCYSQCRSSYLEPY